MMYGYGQNSGYGYGNMMGGGWWGLFWMAFLAALVIAGIVVLVLWILRSSGHGHAAAPGGPAPMPGHDEAIAIAKRRLANSEITKDQYDEIMRTLNG